MTTPPHLELEREVVAQLSTDPLELVRAGRVPMQRDVALAMLSRCARRDSDTPRLFLEAGQLAAAILRADYFCIAAAQREDQAITLQWSAAADEQSASDATFCEVSIEQSDLSAVSFGLQARHPIVIADQETEDRFQDELLDRLGICCGILCPVVYAQQVYGALGVGATSERTYRKADVLFLQSLTLLLGPVLAHRHAESRLARQRESLASTLTPKHPPEFHTAANAAAGHSQRRGVERRSHPRQACSYVQSIGPIRNGRLPQLEQFLEVTCRDISPRGFSFLTTDAPSFREFVVAFGSHSVRMYLRARVVHVSASRHQGQEVLLVGSEYTDRVHLD